MTETTRALADHVAGLRYDDLPTAAVEQTSRLVLDALGIALRASVDVDSAGPLRDVALRLAGNGRASIVGERRRVHPAHAALVNGTFCHGLDFDDTHRDGTMHPGTVVIPTVLALAEHHGVGGRRIVAAIAAGYDVACRLSVAIVPRAHRRRGFHPTGTVGVFGATAAGANLLGLSSNELVNAFGINGSQAAGSMQFMENGSANKHAHPGFAAHNAILAIELARHGFLGSASPIEGPHGLLRAYSDGADPGLAVAGLGEHYAVLETAIKPYPACRYAHTGIDIIRDLVADHDVRADEVTALRIGLCDAAIDIVGAPLEDKRHVKNVVDAQSSMPFVAAVALLRGTLRWSDFELVGDPEATRVAELVHVAPDAEANAVYPRELLTLVELETGRGTFADRRSTARGEPDDPLRLDEVEQKFHELASAVLPEADRSTIVRRLRELPDLPDLGGVTEILRRSELVATDRRHVHV